MKNFINFIWEWAIDNAYSKIIFVLLPSAVLVFAQALYFAGAITTNPNNTEYVNEGVSFANAVLYCVGVIGDIGSLFSLFAFGTRVYRDIRKMFR